MATPLQQAQCELLAFPWTPDVLAMCNLLAASAGDIADMQRSYDTQSKSSQTPFNALLMPEMANLQEGVLPVQAPHAQNGAASCQPSVPLCPRGRYAWSAIRLLLQVG